jgi:hypothetical protein
MPEPLESPKIDRLIAEVAARHGVLLRRDDAAFALVTLNQLVLEDGIKDLTAQIRTATAEFESTFERVQARAGAAVAKDLRQLIVELRSHVNVTAAELNHPAPIPMSALAGMHWLLPFVGGLTVGLLLHWLW